MVDESNQEQVLPPNQSCQQPIQYQSLNSSNYIYPDLGRGGFYNPQEQFQQPVYDVKPKKQKSKMQFGDLVDMFQPDPQSKKKSLKRSKSTKSSGKVTAEKQTENDHQLDVQMDEEPECKPKSKKKKESTSKPKKQSSPKKQSKDSKFEQMAENGAHIKKRGRPPKAQNLCLDVNEMTQADEKPKKTEPTSGKHKNSRKGVLRGKYNKKPKIVNEFQNELKTSKLYDSISDKSISRKSDSDDESFSYSPPRKQIIEPVLQKSKSKSKQTQVSKKASEQIKIVDKSVYDIFMELNAKTLKWQQDYSVAIEGSDEKSFLQNTLVNNNFSVFVIDSIWIQKLRMYMSQAFQIYNNIHNSNEEKKNKNKSKSKAKSQDAQENEIKDQQKNLITLSQNFYEQCELLTNKPLIDQSAKNRTGLNIIKKITYIEQYDVILPCFHMFLLEKSNIFNINTKVYTPIQRKFTRSYGIRTYLDLYLQLVIVKYKGLKFHFQFSLNSLIFHLKKDIQNQIQLNENGFNISDYLLVKEYQSNKTLVDEGKLKDYINLSESKKNCPSPIAIELHPKSNLPNDQIINYRPALYDDCNYCRQNSQGIQKKKKRNTFACICQNVYYCSTYCAKLDLNFHKQQCLKNKNEIQNLNEWTYDIDIQNLQKYSQRRGLVGLQNLTNSCYMNCTLQCLSHCKALTNYFLQGKFIQEINNQNPLGSQGLLAIAFAQEIKKLWSGEQPVVIPQNFKSVLARFKKQFANLDQQDSQELLNILLDSLSEDLNRVKVKPLVPMIESHGENDQKASYDSWKNHLKRSQSIIVDLMHGQFKSTVRCPELDCNHLSITFEPFMMISLPIPEIKLISKQFVWVPYDIKKKSSVHKFIIKGHESIKNLRKYLVNEILSQQGLCYDENGFEIVQISQDKIKRIMCHQNQAVGLQNQSQHLFVFELNSKSNNEIIENPQTNSISEEIDSRLAPNTILSFLNFQINDYVIENQPRSQRSSGNEEADKPENETYFPRLKFFKLDDSLIQIHLQIFNQLKYQFTRFLELREAMLHKGGYQSHNIDKNRHVSTIEDKLFFKKLSMNIPLHLTLEKWNRMTLEEQYELVFSSNSGFKDPSRRKPNELPYFVRLVSRRIMRVKYPSQESSEIELGFEDKQSRESKRLQEKEVLQCIYCKRIKCCGCPLPFEDKLTLKDFLTQAKVSIRSTYFFQDDDLFNERQAILKQAKKDHQNRMNRISKQNELLRKNQKLVANKKSSQKAPDLIMSLEEYVEEDDNQDFEIIVQFNKNSCWGLYELLVRGQNQRATLMSSLQKQKLAKKSEPDQKDLLHQQFLKAQDNQYFIDKVTISDCFRQFDRPEKLSWQNEWYCDHCKQHKQAVKKIQVYKTPPILIINLKRFKGHIQNQKQNTPVHYPIKGLQMNDFMIKTQDESIEDQRPMNLEQRIMNDNVYDLFAVVLHTGTLNGGHYTAIAKNKKSWFEFNDDKVFKLARHERQRIVSNHAYILFYQKRGIDFENIKNYDLIKNTLDNQEIKFPITQFQEESENDEEDQQDDEHEEEEEEVDMKIEGPELELQIEMSPVAPKQVITMTRPDKSFRFIMDEPFSDRDSFLEVNHSNGNGFPRKKTYMEWVEEDLKFQFFNVLNCKSCSSFTNSQKSESDYQPQSPKKFVSKRRLKFLAKKKSLKVKLSFKSPRRRRRAEAKLSALVSVPYISNSELFLRSDEILKLPNHNNKIQESHIRNFLMTTSKRIKKQIETRKLDNDLENISKAIRQNQTILSKIGSQQKIEIPKAKPVQPIDIAAMVQQFKMQNLLNKGPFKIIRDKKKTDEEMKSPVQDELLEEKNTPTGRGRGRPRSLSKKPKKKYVTKKELQLQQQQERKEETDQIRTQILGREEFLQRINVLMNDPNIQIDEKAYEILLQKLRPLVNDQMKLGGQKINHNTQVILNLLCKGQSEQNMDIKEFIKQIKEINESTTNKIQIFLDNSPKEEAVSNVQERQSEHYKMSETFSEQLQMNQSIQQEEMDIEMQQLQIEDDSQVSEIILEFPVIEPLPTEVIVVTSTKRYRYWGDYLASKKHTKEGKKKPVKPPVQIVQRESSHSSDEQIVEQKRKVGRPRKNKFIPKQNGKNSSKKKGLTDFSLTSSPVRNSNMASPTVSMVVINKETDLNQFVNEEMFLEKDNE